MLTRHTFLNRLEGHESFFRKLKENMTDVAACSKLFSLVKCGIGVHGCVYYSVQDVVVESGAFDLAELE